MKNTFALALLFIICFAANAKAGVAEGCNQALQSALLQPAELESGVRVVVDSIQPTPGGDGFKILYFFTQDRHQLRYSSFVRSLPAECQ